MDAAVVRSMGLDGDASNSAVGLGIRYDVLLNVGDARWGSE